MKTLLCGAVLAVFALAATAEVNVSGKWTGSVNATTPEGAKEEPALLLLKQRGAEITGTAGPNEGEQYPISKGSIAGDKVTLEVSPHEGQVIKLELVLAEERMKGDVTMSRDGESHTGKLDVSRAK